MDTEFAITDWTACAAGLAERSQWQNWAMHPTLPTGEPQAPLTEMSAMLRRRLGPLGRMAAQVAYRGHGPAHGIPVVFASRYGDAQRSLSLLRTHASDEPLSPADFALSVHNAIGAMYSIACRDVASYTSVAGGEASAAAGVVEALGLLADGAPEVLLVCYDAPLPDDYAAFDDPAAVAYAWAWRLSRPTSGAASWSLACVEDATLAPAQRPALPFGLDALRFMLSQDAALDRTAEGLHWHWRRHG